MTRIGYRPPTLADGEALAAFAREVFDDTFASHFPAAPFREFLDRSYGVAGTLRRDLADPKVRWRIAEADGAIVGYVKLVPLRAPVEAPPAGALELQQIYVRKDWQGRGAARDLMDWTIATARAAGAPMLYLTVFDWNDRAKAFYARHGFAEIGQCAFRLGDTDHDDRIWGLAL